MGQKRILSIQDISCIGKCSNTVALPILSALGHECAILPTALLSTQTGGFDGYTFLELSDEMEKIIGHWNSISIKFDAVLCGFLGHSRQFDIISRLLSSKLCDNAKKYIDPVLGDKGELYSIYDDGFIEGMRALILNADLITPNITEAFLLSGIKYFGDGFDDANFERFYDYFKSKNIKKAVITGVRFSETGTGTVAFDIESGKTETFKTQFLNDVFHGAGDTFSSALCAVLESGVPFFESVKKATEFVFLSSKNTINSPVQKYGLEFEPILKELIK